MKTGIKSCLALLRSVVFLFSVHLLGIFCKNCKCPGLRGQADNKGINKQREGGKQEDTFLL